MESINGCFTSMLLITCNPHALCLQDFLSGEQQNNAEKDKKLGGAERLAAKLRLEHHDSETARMQFKDEVCHHISAITRLTLSY